jgi:hypothetical protein
MKLIVAIPKRDIDETFMYETISEDADDSVLREKGFVYAESKGESRGNLCWNGNIVMGNKPLHPVKKWEMSLSDGSILTIE